MADEVDYANARAEAFISDALARTLRPLQQLATGTGLCKLCCDPIEAARINARPTAHHCADCAAEIEDDRQRMAKTGRR